MTTQLATAPATNTMKVIRLHEFGGPEVLHYEDAPMPELKPGEVLVRVHAVGINPPDWYLADGYKQLPPEFRPPVPLPAIPGSDVSFLREHGADEFIDYTKSIPEDVAHDLDLVLDTLGGPTTGRFFRTLKRGGALFPVFPGFSDADEAARLGVTVSMTQVRSNGPQLAELGRLLDAGTVRVAIDSTFPLAEAQKAHERAASGHIRGKIVLTVAGFRNQNLRGTIKELAQLDEAFEKTVVQNPDEPGVSYEERSVGARSFTSRKPITAFLLSLVLFAAAASSAIAQSSSIMKVQLYTLDCGLTEFKNAEAFSDTGEYEGRSVALPTPCYLIHHGKEWMLWDTGNGDRLAALPNGESKFGGRFTMRRTLVEQLAQLGLKPDDIRFVALSHLHQDHSGNIGLFPKTTFLIAASELAWARGNPTPFGVDPASINLLSQARIDATDEDRDVFGDGSVRILKAPGHTPGSRMLLIKLTKSGTVLVSGDLYHTRENYEKGLVPTPNVSRADTLASFQRFAGIAANTHARVVIQHAPEDFAAMPAFPKYLD